VLLFWNIKLGTKWVSSDSDFATEVKMRKNAGKNSLDI
jgi:hypothetical protein